MMMMMMVISDTTHVKSAEYKAIMNCMIEGAISVIHQSDIVNGNQSMIESKSRRSINGAHIRLSHAATSLQGRTFAYRSLTPRPGGSAPLGGSGVPFAAR